jgi:ADP-heptose:LPS heptosyltransferase
VSSDPQNILVIHFGQLGDVILGLPALDAVRGRFPGARITTLSGMPADQILRLAGLADEVVAVDRWALKRGAKGKAVLAMAELARDLRRRRFDAVLDLHPYYETGLLARLSGAGVRVAGFRSRRTLTAAYTAVAPPEDPATHYVERYLAIAALLGAPARTDEPRLAAGPSDAALAHEFLAGRLGGGGRGPVVGLNPGAGWEVRRWPGERFVALGRALTVEGARVCVFAGPEEPGLGHALAAEIGPGATGVEGLTLEQLAAAMRGCDVVVSNDTGPAHIAAAVGSAVVILMPGNAGPSPFAVRSHRALQLFGATVRDITVDDALGAARAALGRMARSS